MVQNSGRDSVFIVQYFVEHVPESRLWCFLLEVQHLLPDKAFPAVVTDMHFIVSADFRIAPQNMTEQAGERAHMAQQENMRLASENCARFV